MAEDLHHLHDDMVAFIEGHGMRRFIAYVPEDVQSVVWDPQDNPDAWKDFVELAKASGAPFVTISNVVLERDDIDSLVNRLRNSTYTNEDDVEDARWLRQFTGKTGFVQLGFPFQGTIFLYEVSTDWYDRYQRLMDAADEFGSIVFDDNDEDETR